MRHNNLNKGGIWPVVKRIHHWDRNNKTIKRINTALNWILVVLLLITLITIIL
jgi:hypothetical protein